MDTQKNSSKISFVMIFFFLIGLILMQPLQAHTMHSEKKLAYIVSDINIPFWEILSRGISEHAKSKNYQVIIYNSQNKLKKELEATIDAIKNKVDGIIISPISSSSCSTVLKFANKANIPVVVADIGTDKGEYVSYISSNNEDGAYKIGKILSQRMIELGWEDGSVGIVAIPQKRSNGQARTKGFIRALSEAGIKSAQLKQQSDFSYQETYTHVKDMLRSNPSIRAIWLQGSDKYQAALDAIDEAGKTGKILLITFDAEPEFIELIQKGVILAAAMQQPYLMGEKAIEQLDNYLHKQELTKYLQLSVLPVSSKDIEKKLPLIKRNVLGITH